jgi:hypothetical protein
MIPLFFLGSFDPFYFMFGHIAFGDGSNFSACPVTQTRAFLGDFHRFAEVIGFSDLRAIPKIEPDDPESGTPGGKAYLSL